MLYPQSNVARMVTTLNGFWRFKVESKSIDPQQPLQDPIAMAVPASFNDQIIDKQLRDHDGYFWYETNFEISKLAKTQRNVLHFGSVTHEATVYVNGHEVGHHIGGFTPFEIEIDDYIKVGENDLKVRVSNLLNNTTLPTAVCTQKDGIYNVKPRFDFYNYAGIHRPVRIYTTDRQAHIDEIIVKYDTDLKKTLVKPVVKTTGNYTAMSLEITDQEGKLVENSHGANEKDAEPLYISDTHLWQPLHAYLYKLKVTLWNENNEIIDTYTQPFGVRTIKIDDYKILVNNKPIYLKGFGRHEDFPIIGKGENCAVINHDHQMMKWIGANAFRTSHYPYSEEEMQLADQDGFLVIDEVPAVGLYAGFSASLTMKAPQNTWEVMKTQKAHQQVIREMISRDQNHPCVLAWSLANEPASQEKGAHEYFEPLVKLTKELDWQKLPVVATNIMMASADKDLISDLFDIICLNRYYGWYVDFNDLEKAKKDFYAELTAWHQKYPNKPIVLTEFGADTLAGMHSMEHEPYSEEYQQDYYEANFEVIDECDYVMGELLWNFADFATPAELIRIHGNRKGIFTRDREPKAFAYVLQKRWHNLCKPMCTAWNCIKDQLKD